jgi:hypothetical protein
LELIVSIFSQIVTAVTVYVPHQSYIAPTLIDFSWSSGIDNANEIARSEKMNSDFNLSTVNFFKDQLSTDIIVIQACGSDSGGCTCGSNGCSCFYGSNGQTL